MRLSSDNRHRPGEAFLAQRLGSTQTGQRGPDDNNTFERFSHIDKLGECCRRRSSRSSISRIGTVRGVSIPTPDEVNEMIAVQFPGTGRTCMEISPTHALTQSVVQPEDLRPGGFISGPTQFGLADAALWYLVFGAIGRIEPMAMTSELSMRYLRPAQGSTLWARATLEKAGRRNVVGTVHLWTDDNIDRVTATAQGTYALPM